jgi:hypothetical protein
MLARLDSKLKKIETSLGKTEAPNFEANSEKKGPQQSSRKSL